MKTRKAWCIASPKGELLLKHIADLRKDAIGEYVFDCIYLGPGLTWKKMYGRGYRCVRLVISGPVLLWHWEQVDKGRPFVLLS